MSVKYTDQWAEYKRKTPYALFPFLF